MNEVNLHIKPLILVELIEYINDNCQNFDMTKSKHEIITKIMNNKFTQPKLCICEFNIYVNLISSINISANKLKYMYGYTNFRIYITKNVHKHKFTPVYDYIGVMLEFFDINNVSISKIKLSPYLGEFNCYEIGMGIRCNKPKDVLVMRKYNVIEEEIKSIFKFTNLNPNTLYMFVLDSKIYGKSLSVDRSEYSYEYKELEKYVDKINNYIGEFCLTFRHGKFSWNRKYKIKEISDSTRDIIRFPSISSFIY